MPKEVTPREIIRPWGKRWRIYYPLRLTGGKAKVRDFAKKSDAEAEARDVNRSSEMLLAGLNQYPIQEQVIISMCVQKVGGVEKLVKAVEYFGQHQSLETRTVAELIQECLDEKKRAGLSKSYLRVLRDDLRNFSATFGRREAQTIKGREIADWLHGRAEWSDYTKRNALINLGTLFSFGVAHKYLPVNPVASVEKVKISLGARCVFLVDEAERLMRSLERNDPGLIPINALVLFGGLRPDEARRCRWEFIKDVIDLPAGNTKNNKRRLVELSSLPTLRAWLVNGGEMQPRNVQRRMNKVRELSCVGASGPCLPVKWGHDILRHSFVSYAVPIFGVSQTALMADHSETVLNRHYRELVRRADAERFWSILPSPT